MPKEWDWILYVLTESNQVSALIERTKEEAEVVLVIRPLPFPHSHSSIPPSIPSVLIHQVLYIPIGLRCEIWHRVLVWSLPALPTHHSAKELRAITPLQVLYWSLYLKQVPTYLPACPLIPYSTYQPVLSQVGFDRTSICGLFSLIDLLPPHHFLLAVLQNKWHDHDRMTFV